MDDTERETRISMAFVRIADTLTSDFTVAGFLHTLLEQCTQILDVTDGGLMLVDSEGQLQAVASTDEVADRLGVFQIAAASGPGIDSFRTGLSVSIPDIERASGKWPEFEKAALAIGFHSVYAIPLKLRDQVIGTMNLFGTARAALDSRDLAVARGLSDVATIGIIQERMMRQANVVADQLTTALDSRIPIEQAKGIIARSLSISVNEAYRVLQAHSRNNNLTIRYVAGEIVAQRLRVTRRSKLVSIEGKDASRD